MEQMPLINVNGHEPRDVEAILIFIYSGGKSSVQPPQKLQS